MGRHFERAWARARQAFHAPELRSATELQRVASARFAISVFALVSSTLGALPLAVVLVSPAWFVTLSSIFDASPLWAWVTSMLFAGPIITALTLDCRAIGREPWQWRWQRWGAHSAVLVSIAYIVADALILRGPWLLGQAGRTDRVSVWTASLSSTYEGVPFAAFGLSLGYGMLLWCVTSAFIRAYCNSVPVGRARHSPRIRVFAWVWCAFLFVTGFAALCSFATGGAV